MKNLKKFFRSTTGEVTIEFFGGMFIIILLGVIMFLSSQRAKAQPYFTNGEMFGASQYNANYSTPLFPSTTLKQQAGAGVLSGQYTLTGGATCITNSFGTNIFSLPPVVVAGSSTTNCYVVVTSTTTSNCVLLASVANSSLNWIAVGH